MRPSDDRGTTRNGWLDARHSFSFGQYLDARHMGFGPLRALNENRLAPATSFPMREHANMEILSIVVDGTIEHRDSAGAIALLRPGAAHLLSAGTGTRRRIGNASGVQPLHFLQLWIVPERDDLAPRSEVLGAVALDADTPLRLIAAGTGTGTGAGTGTGEVRVLALHRDVRVFMGSLRAGRCLRHAIAPLRGVWVQVIAGALTTGPHRVDAGDGFSLTDAEEMSLHALADTQFLLVELQP
ncbi:MAG: pirin family protein [Pseudomonadota bacterium]